MPQLSRARLFQPTILLALALLVVIAMMILPMPSWVLDVGLALSFSLAILMFTVTLFIERPLDFSAFPTVLLASLMLRLSLNVSSTKLIIGEGHTGTGAAGNVIQGFASFVMSGSVFLGLVVFCVLLIVNFVVITKGAGRMAEVGARFALDAMPGKQLAIDSDMSAGAIDHNEARLRREREQAETTFFGSLDGASKFVKGDAVAGLLITLLNLVMGLAIGVLMHKMPVGRAFETYAILTVGDGLVSQIPAVIISIAAALLLSRGNATGSADLSFFSQLGRYPPALATVSLMMVLFSLVPGLPFLPFVLAGAALGYAAYAVHRKNLASLSANEGDNAPPPTEEVTPTMGDILDLDDLHVEFAPDLVGMMINQATGLDARIANMRKHIAETFGVIMPEVRLTDSGNLPPGTYSIKVQGVEQARDVLRCDHVLALVTDDGPPLPGGEDVKEPVYGAAARWVSPIHREDLVLAGVTVVNPSEVLATHLLEVTRRNLPRIFTMKSLRKVLDELTGLSDADRAAANRRMIDDIIPDKVSMEQLLAVLKLLLEERVSIRNMTLILETVAAGRPFAQSNVALCEHVRQKLGFQLVAEIKRADGTLPLLQLAPEWEDRFSASEVETSPGQHDVALPPDDFNRLASALAEKIEKVGNNGIFPALATSGRRRRFLQTVVAAKGLGVPVLSFEEIGIEARPSVVGFIAP